MIYDIILEGHEGAFSVDPETLLQINAGSPLEALYNYSLIDYSVEQLNNNYYIGLRKLLAQEQI